MDKLSNIIKENAFASCSAQNTDFSIKKPTNNFKKEFDQKIKYPGIFLSLSSSLLLFLLPYLWKLMQSWQVYQNAMLFLSPVCLITLCEALEGLKGHRPFAKSIPSNEFHLSTWEINVKIKPWS